MNQISPLAFVHPEAQLGDNNIIGPFCYIDKNTVIGSNNVFQNGVTIHTGARIGNGNEIFPGASISTKPQKASLEITTPYVRTLQSHVVLHPKGGLLWGVITSLWRVCT